MKTISGQKSLAAIENREFAGGAGDYKASDTERVITEQTISHAVFLPSEGLSRHRRDIRGRSQPRRAAHHGSGLARGSSAGEAETVSRPRYLPDDGAPPEFVDDRTGYVAFVPEQVKPALPKVLHKGYYEVAAIHAVLGITAELLGLDIALVAGTDVLPQWLRFKHWKGWMRTELALWMVVLLSGVGTYCAWYVAPFHEGRSTSDCGACKYFTATGGSLAACYNWHGMGWVGALRLCRTIRCTLRPASPRVTEGRSERVTP